MEIESMVVDQLPQLGVIAINDTSWQS